MLKLNIKKHCHLRNYSNPVAFLRENGFTNWRAHQLCDEKRTSIPFADLEKLCRVFHCTPNDLLEWTPEVGENAADHALAEIRPQQPVSLSIKTLSYAQLKEIARIVNEKG